MSILVLEFYSEQEGEKGGAITLGCWHSLDQLGVGVELSLCLVVEANTRLYTVRAFSSKGYHSECPCPHSGNEVCLKVVLPRGGSGSPLSSAPERSE